MKTRFYVIFLIVCALLDDFLSMYLPVDFEYQTISYIPHFCFCALLVLCCSRSWLDRVLIGALCGILTDYFFHGTFPCYFILYAFLCFLSGIFYQAMEKNDRIQILYLWILTFLLDFIPFQLSVIFKELSVSFKMWFVHFEITTLMMNVFIVIFMVYIFNVYDRYCTIQTIRKRKVEKRKFHNLKLSRK